jgi:hypothetical protein
MLYFYLFIPSIVSFISYVNFIRSYDVYRIIKLNKYYFFNYSFFDTTFIIIYLFLLTYNLLLIYHTTRIYYNKFTFSIDNLLHNINFNTVDNKDCSICLEDFDNSKQICQLIQCSHLFHKNCIIEWYNISNQFSCPYCRCVAIYKN